MEPNVRRLLASDLFLVENWNSRSEPPVQRRNQIFEEFVRLGMRGRWSWHARAEKYEFGQYTQEERNVVLGCRDWPTYCIAKSLGEELSRVVMTDHAGPIDLEFRIDWDGDSTLVCQYGGSPFHVLPELVYSFTAFDDPDDVEEARQSQRDQSLWVSGVFWIDNKITWVDEFGATVREKVCDVQDRESMREAAEAFERYRPFESTWWIEATKVGKYAGDRWWL